VSAGALLFRIDGPILTAMQEAQQTELRSVTARLRMAHETVKRKETALKAAKKALEARTRALMSQLALAEQTAAAREAAFKQHLSTAEQVAVARAEVARLTADLSSVRSEKDRLPAGDELAEAQRVVYELESAVAAVKARVAKLEARTRLRAPFDGVFTDRKVSAGQTVRSGDVLGTVVDPRHLRVAARLFPPVDAALDGAQAEILLPGREQVAVEVDRIVARSTSDGAVTLWLTGPALEGRFRPGTAVSGLVVLTHRRNALAVPRTALVYGPDETPFVFVKTSGGPRRIRVRTGVVQGNWIEVRSGLREDQAVVVRGAYELFFASFSRTYKVAD